MCTRTGSAPCSWSSGSPSVYTWNAFYFSFLSFFHSDFFFACFFLKMDARSNPHDHGCFGEGYRNMMSSRCNSEHCAVRQMFQHFCNRQQHNYFVLLFVSFCTEKEKKGKKKGRESMFSMCFQCLAVLVPNRMAALQNCPVLEWSRASARSSKGVNKVPL